MNGSLDPKTDHDGARRLTWMWMLRRLAGLPAVCPACLFPSGRGHRCNWTDDPPPSSQWKKV